MATLVPSFLIGSSFLQVRRAYINARISSHEMQQLTTEFGALERLKINDGRKTFDDQIYVTKC